MKTHQKIIMGIFLLTLILSSCVSFKQLTYLKFMGEIDNPILPATDIRTAITPSAYKLMTYDILYINVSTPDPQWSALFNTASGGSGGTLTLESAALTGYPVDEDGNIELPFIGNLEVVGKTLSEIKVSLDATLKNYVSDASITVRLVNNYVSIIGEVNAPGRYPLTKYQLSVFEALSMAGDMSFYSDRQKVHLIRQSPNGPVVKEFSLKDKSILTSEYYYIMPNDIIYVLPLRARTFQINSSTYTLILSSLAMILTSVTTILILFGYSPSGSN